MSGASGPLTVDSSRHRGYHQKQSPHGGEVTAGCMCGQQRRSLGRAATGNPVVGNSLLAGHHPDHKPAAGRWRHRAPSEKRCGSCRLRELRFGIMAGAPSSTRAQARRWTRRALFVMGVVVAYGFAGLLWSSATETRSPGLRVSPSSGDNCLAPARFPCGGSLRETLLPGTRDCRPSTQAPRQ